MAELTDAGWTAFSPGPGAEEHTFPGAESDLRSFTMLTLLARTVSVTLLFRSMAHLSLCDLLLICSASSRWRTSGRKQCKLALSQFFFTKSGADLLRFNAASFFL